MSLTGAQLLTGFSTFIDDLWESSITTGTSGSSVDDTAVEKLGGDDRLIGRYFRMTTGGEAWEIARVLDSTSATGTMLLGPDLSGTPSPAETYDLHRFDPVKKFAALDAARIELADDVFQLIYDETLTTDGRQTEYDVPSSIRNGPLLIYVERPLSSQAEWNFVKGSAGISTDNWTATSTTASEASFTTNDPQIPKYSDGATKLATATATNGTYKQVVADMENDITAILAGGREMTFASWVFCRVASRVSLTLEDGTDESNSSTHGGAGWELLKVTKDIADANTTTLTVGFDVTNDTGAVDMWWNHAWFYFGDANKVSNIYGEQVPFRLRRDGVVQRVRFLQHIGGGRQLRLIGRDILSALGTTPATQVTNTMEIDEVQAELLYSKASEIMFGWEGINTSNMPLVANRMRLAEARRRSIRNQWAQFMPSTRMTGPFSG